MKSLFSILEEYKEITAELIENEGELDDSLEDRLNINANEVVNKVEGYFYVISNFKSKEQMLDEEIKRLLVKKNGYVKAQTVLKSQVDRAVALYGEDNLKSKAKFISKVVETELVKATAIAYPILKATTIPEDNKLAEEIPQEYLTYSSSLKLTKKEADLLEQAVMQYNSELEIKIPVPKFDIKLDTTKAKEALLSGIEVGGLEIDKNYRVKYS